MKYLLPIILSLSSCSLTPEQKASLINYGALSALELVKSPKNPTTPVQP